MLVKSNLLASKLEWRTPQISGNINLHYSLLCLFNAEHTGEPPRGRCSHSATVIGSKIYYFGGNNSFYLFI